MPQNYKLLNEYDWLIRCYTLKQLKAFYGKWQIDKTIESMGPTYITAD